MNERLKELYLRAHSIRHYDNDPSLAGNPPTVYWHGEVSAQRFAELIVQEMLRLLEQYSRDSFPEDTTDDFDKGYPAGLHTAQKAVKKHFGVEE